MSMPAWPLPGRSAATNNARESTRLKGIAAAQFDYVISTQEFTTLCQLLRA
jgi:hypothetical protein